MNVKDGKTKGTKDKTEEKQKEDDHGEERKRKREEVNEVLISSSCESSNELHHSDVLMIHKIVRDRNLLLKDASDLLNARAPLGVGHEGVKRLRLIGMPTTPICRLVYRCSTVLYRFNKQAFRNRFGSRRKKHWCITKILTNLYGSGAWFCPGSVIILSPPSFRVPSPPQ